MLKEYIEQANSLSKSIESYRTNTNKLFDLYNFVKESLHYKDAESKLVMRCDQSFIDDFGDSLKGMLKKFDMVGLVATQTKKNGTADVEEVCTVTFIFKGSKLYNSILGYQGDDSKLVINREGEITADALFFKVSQKEQTQTVFNVKPM